MKTFIFEGITDEVSVEDGGQAKITTIYEGDGINNNGVFFRFQSWCENGKDHPVFDSLITRARQKVRITMEVEE